MKLSTLKNLNRDGRLVVVSRDLAWAVDAGDIAATLQEAVERWAHVESVLRARYDALNEGTLAGAFAFDPQQAAAPLPRAWQWLDASSFLSHGERMQKAFGLDPIEGVEHTPLMYQGCGDDFLGAHDDIKLPSETHGIDFEGEFAVLVDEVPMGCSAQDAVEHIRLIVQVNDVSLRALAPRGNEDRLRFYPGQVRVQFCPGGGHPRRVGRGLARRARALAVEG